MKPCNKSRPQLQAVPEYITVPVHVDEISRVVEQIVEEYSDRKIEAIKCLLATYHEGLKPAMHLVEAEYARREAGAALFAAMEADKQQQINPFALDNEIDSEEIA
jgi:hypothetical protein